MTDPTAIMERRPLVPVPKNGPLAPDEKAAVIVYALGAERAGKLLGQMDENDYRRLARAMNRLGTIGQVTAEAVMAEFSTIVGDNNTIRGGTDETRKFLGHFLDSGLVDRMMEEIGGPPGRDVWEKLSNTSEQHLFAYLRTERPQSAAVILTRLHPDKAAKVLALFPDDQAKEIVLRMSRVGAIGPAAMEELKTSLQQDFLAGLQKQRGTPQPHDLIGTMFNQMPPDKVTPILHALQEHNPECADRVQKAMFTFPDFSSRVSSVDLQTVIKNCDREVLLLALMLAKQNSPDVLEYFYNNMSKRVVEQMREEMQNAGPVRMKDAQAAQQELVKLAQNLAKTGEITLTSNEDDDDEIVS